MTSIAIFFICCLICCANPLPLANNPETDAKGILDGVAGSSTASPSSGGLGGLSELGQNVGNAGPMLILGSFQAVVTKFDPALVQGLPGLSSVPSVG